MSQVNLTDLVRGNVKTLKAYQVESMDCGIMLHANENPYAPPAELIDRFKEKLQQIQLNRYPDPESRELKKAISRRIGVPVESLVIGNGSDELIQLLLQIFCEQGDAIAFPDPTFAMYSIIAQGMGLNPRGIPLDENWDFKAEAFLEAIEKHNPKMVFFSYPNNPTGNCFSEGEIRKVIEAFRGIVVVDEAYQDFSRKSFIDDIKRHNNMFILRSLSKIGLAALRVGYGVMDPQIVEQIDKVRLPYNSNTVSQAFAEQLLTHFDPVQKQIDTLLEERDRIVHTLSKLKSVTVFRSDSNFILFRVEKNAGGIFKDLMESGILIRNLGSHPRLNNCLRVTVGTPEENEQFLAHMSRMAG